jgi:hypothetical protein
MRHTIRTAGLGLTLTLAMAACNWSSIRNCQVEAGQDAGNYGLDYSMKIPTNCPVDLLYKGELKFAGAIILDYGNLDFDFAITTVQASNGGTVGVMRDDFRDGPGGVRTAVPVAFYPAATGFTGTITPGQVLNATATDHGKFQVYFGPGIAGPFAQVAIPYRGSSLAASISGPDVPLAGSSGSWSAAPSGGVTPYSYQWYRNGDPVGTGSTYSASAGPSEFGLRVIVTDQSMSTRTTDYWVHVDGIRTSISGPTYTYASEGGGSWTASVRGGYPPYTYEWYLVTDSQSEQVVGSGSSWSGYPGQGNKTLGVHVHDSHGASFDSTLEVTGFGTGDGSGCDPVPPQFTCMN